MSDHSCPVHDFIPCVDVRAGTMMWPARMLSEPRFPFYCTNAEVLEWFTAREAAEQGLVHVAYDHDAKDYR